MSRLSQSQVILRYYLYRATAHPGFFYPIYTLFLLYNGITLSQIAIIAGIQAFVIVVGEVPTGYVGDRIGRRNSLAMGSFLLVVSNASYLIATDFIGFLFTFVALSFGHTFNSGSGSAWLYDTLKEHDIEDEFTRVSGRAGAIGRWVSVFGLIAGGLLYSVDKSFPFYAGVAMALINLVLVLRMPKNIAYDEDVTDGDDDRLTIIEALPVIREQLADRSLRSFIAYMALFSGAILTMDIYLQPIARSVLEVHFKPLLNSLGLAKPALFGFMYASFAVISAILSDYASNVEDALGVRLAMLTVPGFIAISYVAAGFAGVLAFPMFFMMKGGSSLVFPISGRYVNDQIESVGRATVLSTVSMLRSIAGIPFRFLAAGLVTFLTALDTVAVLGGLFIVCSALLWVFSPPVSSDYVAPTSTKTTPASSGSSSED